MRGTGFALLLVMAGVALARPASADTEAAACIATAERGQQLRSEAKLIEAREQFVLCGRATCPTLLQKDCTQWVAELAAALPSVVFSATDARGKDLRAVRVVEGNRVVADTLGGTGTSVNPGEHTFRFTSASGDVVIQTIIVREGEKNRVVAVTFGAGPVTKTEPSPPAAPVPSGSSGSTVAWVIGGVGVAAIGVGAFFGVRAIGKRSDSDRACPNGSCSAEGVSLNDEALTSAWVANIGIGAGLVGVGVATYLLLTRSTPPPAAPRAAMTGSVRVLPSADVNGAGVAVGGSF